MFYVIKGRRMLLFGLVVLCMSFVYLGYTGLTELKVDQTNVTIKTDDKDTIDKPSNGTDSKTVNKGKIVSDSETGPKAEIVLPKESLIPKSDDYFAEYRMERDRTRGQRLEYLREIVNNTNSSNKMRDETQQEILNITRYMGQETKLENLIIAKGFKEAVVFIEKDSVTIVIPGENISQSDIAKIADLAVRSTGCKIEQVYITPKKGQ